MIELSRSRTTPFILFLALGWTAIATVAAPISDQLTRAESQDLQREARLVVDLLQNHHYAGKSFRELDSATMINRFLDELDPRAEFLDLGDAEYVHRRFDRTLKSVYLFRGDLQPAFEIFDRFVERARTRLHWAQERLDRDFDFTVKETYQERTEPSPFKTQADADHYWELLLKAQVLTERLRGREPADATKEIKQYYAQVERIIAAYDPLAVRERFFDAIIRSYDPHSGYFSSDSAREFAMEMEKSVVGLGVELRKEDGNCVVSAIQPGGPADLAAELAPGDILVALAEGETGPWVDLANLRLREIVDLIRGPAESKLRLAYRHAGQTERLETTVDRKRVELAANRARGAVSDVPAAAGPVRHIGWIHLPSFYAAGEESIVSSAARDVRELLQQMNPATLDGLVLDLRNNPGGALTEAVALSEIFLPRGVMMLSRGTDGKVKEHAIKEGAPFYAGPLVLLTSSQSASASEVFAGAMRYHRRAVIVGAPATFGKGTVQEYIELARMAPHQSKDWGTLRVTTERFFQPDGSSVQRTGVAAHVILPDTAPAKGVTREEDLPGALPVETVTAPAGLMPAISGREAVADDLLAQLQAQLGRDAKDLPEWQLHHDEHEIWAQYAADNQKQELVADERLAQWATQRAAWHEVTLRRRALTIQAAYPTQPFEVTAARNLIDAQDARLRTATEGAQPATSFVVTTDHGHRRKLNLETLNFVHYEPDAAVLATAIAEPGAPAWETAAIAKFFQRADLLKYKTPLNVEALAREIFPPDENRARFHHHLEILLQQTAALDGELLRERVGLDVELRESLRLAAAWAEREHAGEH